MADPLTGLAALGAASSVLQIFDFAFNVAKYTKRLLRSTEGALEENIELKSLTLQYQKISEEIADLGNDDSPPTSQDDARAIAKQCTHEAAALLDLIAALEIKDQPNLVKRVFKGAQTVSKALRSREEVARRQARLSRLNDLLATALIKQLWQAYRRLPDSDNLPTVLKNIDGVNDNVAIAVDKAKDEILAELRSAADIRKVRLITNSITYPEIATRRAAIKTAHKRTFEWIFRDETSPFMVWLRSGRDIFWISGKAGSGKSTLMKYS
jgi:hypothetical protein